MTTKKLKGKALARKQDRRPRRKFVSVNGEVQRLAAEVVELRDRVTSALSFHGEIQRLWDESRRGGEAIMEIHRKVCAQQAVIMRAVLNVNTKRRR